MKKTKKILIVLSILGFIGLLSTCYMTGYFVFKGSMQLVTNETTSSDYAEYLRENGIDKKLFDQMYSVEQIEIESTLDGHKIPADYMLADGDKNNDTVILVHGLGGNRLSLYPIAQIYLQYGYNVIAYDQRSSGENTALYTTGGYWESKDLLDYIQYIDGIIDQGKKIGVWGTSFGGATVGIALGDEMANNRLAFAVLDCPMSNIEYMIREEIKTMDLDVPMDFLIGMGNIMTKLKLSFTYDDMNVVPYISKTKVPVLILNSKADTLTPYFMGEELYKAIEHDQKKLFTVEDSKHADIFFDYQESYRNELLNFLP